MLRVGQRVDRYTLIELLGEGGQGSVWRVDDPLAPGTPRVAKLFPTKGASAAPVERLRREGQMLAALAHPSLVRCHGVFDDLNEGVVGLVLDLAPGRPLTEVMRDARWTRAHADQLLRRVVECLAYLHGAGCVHRDIKPENILVDDGFFVQPTDSSFVRLIDLGIAIDQEQRARLTREGTIIGTAAFMAPETIAPFRFHGSTSAPAVDVFGFGVLAWELIFGGHPTGLPDTAGLGDYGVVYVQRASDPSWGAVAIADPWREVLRRSLALDPGVRLRDAPAIQALLTGSAPRPVAASARPVSAPSAGPAVASSAPVLPIAAAPATGARRSSTAVVALALVGIAAVLLLIGVVVAKLASKREDSESASPPPVAVATVTPVRTHERLTPAPDHPCHYVTDGAGTVGKAVNTRAEWLLISGSLSLDKVPVVDRAHPHELFVNGKRAGVLGSQDPGDAPRLRLDRLLTGSGARLVLRPIGGGSSIACSPHGSPPTAAALKSGWVLKCDANGIAYDFGTCLADPDPP